MALCFFIASRSKDPSTQHGAVIVDNKHRIQSTGYNGAPAAMSDNDIDWSRPQKYPFIVHAEANAIDNAHGHPDILHSSTLYVTGPPCSGCSMHATRKGIKKIIYGPQSSKMVDDADWENTKEICKKGNVTLERYAGNLNWIRDRLMWMEENMNEVFQPTFPLPL